MQGYLSIRLTIRLTYFAINMLILAPQLTATRRTRRHCIIRNACGGLSAHNQASSKLSMQQRRGEERGRQQQIRGVLEVKFRDLMKGAAKRTRAQIPRQREPSNPGKPIVSACLGFVYVPT